MSHTAESPVYDTAEIQPNFIREIVEAYRYRHLIWQLILRNIKVRYKRSFLGIAWTMLNPLGMMIVMAVAFSTLFGQAINYRVYLLSGLLAWGFFSESSTLMINNMIWGSDLLHRIYIPRTAFAFSSVGTGIVNLGLSLVPLVLLMAFTGVPVTAAILFTPIPALLILMFTFGVGLTLSVAAMYFADVNEMFKVLLRAWMYLTPIIYPEDLLVDNGYSWLLNLNPMHHLIRVFRSPFQYGVLPTWPDFLTAAGIAASALLIGWFVFNRYSDEFTYRV